MPGEINQGWLNELNSKINNGKPWSQDAVLTTGIYRVGIDIEPGEYLIAPDAPDHYAGWEVKDSSRPDARIIGRDGIIKPYAYLTVERGQYLKLRDDTIATFVRHV